MLTPAQVRAARALLNWTQEDLAQATKLFVGTIKEFEQERSNPKRSTLLDMERALKKAGVEFIEPEGGKGPGVRLAKEP